MLCLSTIRKKTNTLLFMLLQIYIYYYNKYQNHVHVCTLELRIIFSVAKATLQLLIMEVTTHFTNIYFQLQSRI